MVFIKSFLLLMVFGLPLAMTGCDMNEEIADGYENISVEQAYKHWQKAEESPASLLFLDVRTAKEYAQGHVPGAVNIPVQVLKERLKDVPKNKAIYVYCESGVRARKASNMLAKFGIVHVKNIPESMAGWRKAGYPIEH